jgi:Spy/CpxP family protein refolding chaperone
MSDHIRVTLLFLTMTFSTLLLAQAAGNTPKDPSTKAKARTEQLTKDLSLTPDQAVQVEALYQVHYRKMAEIKASGADKETIKARSKKQKDTQRAALKRVLTPQQFKRMETLDAERKAAKKSEQKKSDPKGPTPAAKP